MQVINLILLIVTSSCLSASQDLEPYRLPKTIKPTSYDLMVLTDLDDGKFYFKGQVSIDINILQDTSTITVNSKELNITGADVRVKKVNGTSNIDLNVLSTKADEKNEFFIINVEEPLEVGQKYIVTIPFAADLKEGLNGYYRSSYVDKSTGKTKWLAVTQFESTAARKAFPCFDEPSMKATFKVSLGHKKVLKAISNMPRHTTSAIKDKDGWVMDEFEPTVPMSTYLVAYMISDMGYKEHSKTQNNVKFRIWAQKDVLDQVDFALEFGSEVLSFYEKYFGIKFPLPKLDLVAVPDFYQGAMENWGMITFRETAVLVDKNSSTGSKETAAITIAHEIGHQWFGNLVTMKWWSDLWLNEGFASYMESFSTSNIHPDWRTHFLFSLGNLISIMGSDSLKSSHQVSVRIHDPKEIEEVFDSISYTKGSVLINMMNAILGESVFKKGITNYLKKHMYSNAEQDDLWAALTDAAHTEKVLNKNMTVKKIMDTWTLQTGYPVLTVSRDYNKSSATIHQKRYLAIKDNSKDAKKDESCWTVPLSYTSSSEKNFNDTRAKRWLYCNGTVIENIAPANDWVIFNVQFTALYKVMYDIQNWNKLIETLNDPEKYTDISEANRAQIVNDLFDFTWDGDLDYKLAFKLLNYVSHETKYLPLSSALLSAARISGMINKLPIFGDFRNYMKRIIKPLFMKLKKITDIPKAYEDQKIKAFVTGNACGLDLEECTSQAIDLFKMWSKETKPEESTLIPDDYKSLVYCIGIKHGGEKEWNFLWSVYNRTNSVSEKSTIRSALACTHEVWILNKYLYMLIDKNSPIRQQDMPTVLGEIVNSAIGYYVGRDFVYNNMEEIIRVFKDAPPTMFGYFATMLIGQMQTENELKEMKDFIAKYKDLFSASEMSINQSFEAAKITTDWLKKNYNNIKKIVESA